MSDEDRWSFNEGTHADLGRVLGSRLNGQGATFRVWAPSASRVMVIGDFNDWSEGIDLAPDPSGVWNGQLPGIEGPRLFVRPLSNSSLFYRTMLTLQPWAPSLMEKSSVINCYYCSNQCTKL
jgi:hypothetical protein